MYIYIYDICITPNVYIYMHVYLILTLYNYNDFLTHHAQFTQRKNTLTLFLWTSILSFFIVTCILYCRVNGRGSYDSLPVDNRRRLSGVKATPVTLPFILNSPTHCFVLFDTKMM